MDYRPYYVEDLGTSELATISAETTLIECAKRMHDLCVRSLIVTSNDVGSDAPRRPEGILTDRDIVVEAIAFSLDPNVITAGDIMTCPLVTARLDEALKVVHARMQMCELSSIVIVDQSGNLVGMLEVDRLRAVLQSEASLPGPLA